MSVERFRTDQHRTAYSSLPAPECRNADQSQPRPPVQIYSDWLMATSATSSNATSTSPLVMISAACRKLGHASPYS